MINRLRKFRTRNRRRLVCPRATLLDFDLPLRLLNLRRPFLVRVPVRHDLGGAQRLRAEFGVLRQEVADEDLGLGGLGRCGHREERDLGREEGRLG